MQADRTKLLQQAATHLSQHDAVLAILVERIGLCTIQPHTDYYRELVESIISQQLSVKAADTITRRFRGLFGGHSPLPQEILAVSVEQLRSAGLSRAKTAYVQDLAAHILDGRLEVNKLPALSDEAVIAELTAVKGIGEWTAHMFLMFSLGRLDVLPVGDQGIRTGIQRLYQLAGLPDAAAIRELANAHHWHPFASVACWYVWKSLDNEPAIGAQN